VLGLKSQTEQLSKLSKMRQETLDAIAIDVLTEVLGENADAEPLLKKALQRLKNRPTNAQRQQLSRRVLGVSILRQRLAYFVDAVDAEHLESQPVSNPLELLLPPPLRQYLRVMDKDSRQYAMDFLATYILHEERDVNGNKIEGAVPFLPNERRDQLSSLNPDKDVFEPLFEMEESPQVIANIASMPLWLVQKWTQQLCDTTRSTGGLPLSEVLSLAVACNQIPPVSLRVNLLKLGGRKALIEALAFEGVNAEFGKMSPWAVKLTEGRPEGGVWNLAAWKGGFFEVQDEGSQLIALSTQAGPGETVIDYCAGNGGKTLAIAAMMKDQGEVVAHDINETRLAHLRGSMARAGVTCINTLNTSQLEARRDLYYNRTTGTGGADCVLVDAPCSSTGALRRHPSLRWTLDPAEVANYPRLQKEILLNASRMVGPEGGLVYATCAINREENEEVADWFGQEDFERWPFRERGSERRALLPHVHNTDGFFIARWRRRSTSRTLRRGGAAGG